jgi:hypothetical protein
MLQREMQHANAEKIFERGSQSISRMTAEDISI